MLENALDYKGLKYYDEKSKDYIEEKLSEKTDHEEIIGENLIPYPYYNTTITKSGITFTDNGDGTVTVNGTATATVDFLCQAYTSAAYTFKVPAGTYVMSGCPEGGSTSTYSQILGKVVNGSASRVLTNTNIQTVTFTEDTDIYCIIRIVSGTTVSNLTFKPMLEVGTIAHPYQPYNLSRQKLRDDIDTKNTVSVTQSLTSGTKVGAITVDGTATDLYAPNSVATTSANGLMSKQDKSKLNATNIAYGTCSTAAATAAKVITVNGNTNWALTAGAMITIKFSATNTAQNPTFNVNSTGAKSVWYNTALITTSNLGYAGYANRPMNFIYDGTQYVFIGWSMDTNSTYSNAGLGQGYGTCSTAAATTAKVVTLSNYTLTVGGVVAVKFTYAVPASATMNINSKGAKNIFHRGSAITTNVISAGDIATFIYDGTQYHLISIDYGRGTASNYGHVKLSDNYKSSAGTASAGVAASSKALSDAYNEINSNLKWKYWKNAFGTTSIALPEKYEELILEVERGESNVRYSIHVTYAQLRWTEEYQGTELAYKSGHYTTSTNYESVTVIATTTYTRIYAIYDSGQNITASSELRVYYR